MKVRKVSQLNVIDNKFIKVKNLNQFKYLETIDNSTITFGIGPAGTGKTFLSVASAVKMYSENEIKKIVLTRPAVEAGERLGYLPGDLSQKIDPYLVPLFDSLEYFFVNEKLDAGQIILKKSFFIESSDNENTLKYKTQKLEYKAYSEAIIKIFSY